MRKGNLSEGKTGTSSYMKVVRDEVWEKCLEGATAMYRLLVPNDTCYKLADATWKCKAAYKVFQDKKDARRVILLDKTPDAHRAVHKLCASTTMSGKPCSFRAVCGHHCKKHQVKIKSAGTITC